MAVSGDAEDQAPPDDRRMRNVLSEDERRVLDLLSVGLPMHDIAQLLRISDATLQEHVTSLLRHYGAEDRTSLVATAYRRGDAPGLRRLARSVSIAGPVDGRCSTSSARKR